MFLVQIWLSASVTSCHDDQGSTSVWSPHAPSSFNQRHHLTKRGPPFRPCCRSRVWAVCAAFVWAFYFVLFCFILFHFVLFCFLHLHLHLGCVWGVPGRECGWPPANFHSSSSMWHALFAISSARYAHMRTCGPAVKAHSCAQSCALRCECLGRTSAACASRADIPAGMIGIFASGPLITGVSRSS